MAVYDHYRPEEHAFIDQLLEWRDQVTEQYVAKCSDFLDPRQQVIAREVLGIEQNEYTYGFFGGSEQAERKRLVIAPPYVESLEDEAHLQVFEVDYAKKFVTMTHRDLLGSLLGIGLDRDKFGDLLFDGERVQFVCAKEIASFIELQLTKVGNTTVRLQARELEQLLPVQQDGTKREVNASSLRIDTVLSSATGFSRSVVSEAIRENKVKHNWQVLTKPNVECRQGDVLSLRGFGRVTIETIEGQTKKGKWKLSVLVQKNSRK